MGEKHDLIHLHQLLALTQKFLIDKGLPADTESLAEYSAHYKTYSDQDNTDKDQTYADIGVTAIDINATRHEKSNAVTALADELAMLLSFNDATTATPPTASPAQQLRPSPDTAQGYHIDTDSQFQISIAEYDQPVPQSEVAQGTTDNKTVVGGMDADERNGNSSNATDDTTATSLDTYGYDVTDEQSDGELMCEEDEPVPSEEVTLPELLG